jgi:hexosaminidase
VRIAGGDAAGTFHAGQVMRQLLPPEALRRVPTGGVEWSLPGVVIEDEPRHRWRGMLLDVSRHFFGRDVVLKLIDVLALHRLNVLQLHLSDDQGWRLEIDRYPRLTAVGAWRARSMIGPSEAPRGYDEAPHGGFFTKADIREIVAYAARRFITVVPEIDMPGHTQAAIAAYPELGNVADPLPVWSDWGVNPHVVNVQDATIEFFQNVLDEVMELFPGPFVHVGGDECPKDEWRSSPSAQRRMRELGLPDEDALQSWFVGRMDAHLSARGRRLVGWDEILEGGLAPGATVMSWREETGGIVAARAGHDVIMAPMSRTYFWAHQSTDPTAEPPGVPPALTLSAVYDYEPVPAALTPAEAERVLGVQCQMWTEHVVSHRQLEEMVFPRLCAFAERAWGSPREPFGAFLQRLRVHVDRLHALDVTVFPLERSS